MVESRADLVGRACTPGQGGSECPCHQPHFLAKKFKTRGIRMGWSRGSIPFADEEAGVLPPPEWLS